MTERPRMSQAEQRLAAAGITLEEEDFGRDDEPDVGGCLLIESLEGDRIRVKAVIRPGIPDEFREMFAEWAASRIERFIEVGPEPDGWQKRTIDNAWQLWARLLPMPDLGPELGPD